MDGRPMFRSHFHLYVTIPVKINRIYRNIADGTRESHLSVHDLQ